MARYEVLKDNTLRFWEVTREGISFTVTQGLVGTKGEERSFSYPTEEKAARALEQLVASKKALGYELVETPTATKGLWHAPSPELEATILRDRDEDGPWQVYADFLQAQGDVRGQLFALAGQKEAFAVFVEDHLPAIFGDLVPHLDGRRPEVALEWKRGFVDGLVLRANDYEGDTRLTDLARRALALPVTRFLRELTLRIGVYQEGQDFTGALEALADSGRRETLEQVSLEPDCADPDDDWRHEVEWPAWGSLEALSGAPRLEALTVEGTHGDVGELSLPALRRLKLVARTLTAQNVEDLRRSSLPELRRLVLEPRGLALGSGDALCALVSGAALPRLEQLSLERAPEVGEVLPALVFGSLLPRLSRLSLRHCELVQSEVALLLKERKRLAHLKALALPAGWATAEHAAELKTLCARVSLVTPRRRAAGAASYDDVVE
ncbi:MAG: WGR domain-containing protein [Myxococcales bacterium]|nr:WGR domain-containing protein [Myxococcales bacterium]